MADRGGLFGLLDKALDLAIAARRIFVVNDLAGKRVTTPVPLIAAAQDFPAAWGAAGSALGPEIEVAGFTRITLWLSLDINDGADMRVRCMGKHTSGGTGYNLPIYNPSVAGAPGTYNILTEAEYVEFNVDADGLYNLTWDVNNTYPFVYFEIMAGTVGADECAVSLAHVTYGWGS